MLRNDIAFFEAAAAANAIGANVVPINWHLKAAEAGYILRDSGARALVCHEDLLPQIASDIPANLPTFLVATPAEVTARLQPAAGRRGPRRTLSSRGRTGLRRSRRWLGRSGAVAR